MDRHLALSGILISRQSDMEQGQVVKKAEFLKGLKHKTGFSQIANINNSEGHANAMLASSFESVGQGHPDALVCKKKTSSQIKKMLR